MSDPALPSPPPTPAPSAAARTAAPIGHHAMRGVVWTMAQSIGTKLVTTLQQLIIAKYFLTEEDFGKVAMAQVVIMLASVGQSLGVGEILVRRHKTYDRWVRGAFWLNLTGGLLGMLFVLALIPVWEPVFRGVSSVFTGKMKEAPAIGGVLAIWALWLPLDAMATTFTARLRIDMRFRLLAALGSIQFLGLALISIPLAAMGFGAYSVVIPIPVMTAVTLVAARRATGQRVGVRPEVHLWKYILNDSRYFLLTNLFNTLLQQGDYILTGLFFSEKVLGAYYFSYRMSTQTAQLIGANLTSVMLPSFAKLNEDRKRQVEGYGRACAALLLVGLPVCMLQALLAEPAFHLIFADKWDRAIPLFERLSVGMGFTLPTTSATALLLAQGRYRTNTIWTAVVAGMFLVAVFLGAVLGSVNWVALFVGGYFVVYGPATVLLPVARDVSPVGFLVKLYWFPVVAGIVGMAGGWGLSQVAPWGGNAGAILLRCIGWSVPVVALLAIVKPAAASDLRVRLQGMIGKRFAKGADQTTP